VPAAAAAAVVAAPKEEPDMLRTWQMVKTLLTSPGFQVTCSDAMLAD
jgi:hypothetical protein